MPSMTWCEESPQSTEAAVDTEERPLGLLTQRKGCRQITVTGRKSTVRSSPKEFTMSKTPRRLRVTHFSSPKTRTRTTAKQGYVARATAYFITGLSEPTTHWNLIVSTFKLKNCSEAAMDRSGSTSLNCMREMEDTSCTVTTVCPRMHMRPRVERRCRAASAPAQMKSRERSMRSTSMPRAAGRTSWLWHSMHSPSAAGKWKGRHSPQAMPARPRAQVPAAAPGQWEGRQR
mmetsp:Transcript_35070/g.100711  ORF Transcript_35070/g.100711 Transcript_35070/m.100711 type:complete len:231 (-) Transcript_35070:1387-2079(-)